MRPPAGEAGSAHARCSWVGLVVGLDMAGMRGAELMSAVLWFRRDLRLSDHPALLAAAGEGPVVGLFVLDDVLRRPSGAPRIAFLYRTLRALDEQLREHGGAL